MQVQFRHDDVVIERSEPLYAQYFRADAVYFRHRKFAGGWSELVRRELFVRGDAASVMLYDPRRDALVMIEQFRIGAMKSERSPWQLEFVAGVIESGEQAEEVARREAQEEAGAQVEALVHIGKFFTTPGACNERFHCFAAKVDASGLAGIAGLPEEHEDIRVHIVPRETAFAWLDAGHIENAMTALSLQWLRIHGTDW